MKDYSSAESLQIINLGQCNGENNSTPRRYANYNGVNDARQEIKPMRF